MEVSENVAEANSVGEGVREGEGLIRKEGVAWGDWVAARQEARIRIKRMAKRRIEPIII